MVGSFVNNLPARVAVQRDRPVDEWVRDIQRAQGRRQSFAHVSLTDIHTWSDGPPSRPLFDTLVLLNLTDESDLPWPGIELIAESATLDAAYPLLLSVTVDDDRFAFTLGHDSTISHSSRVTSTPPGNSLWRVRSRGASSAMYRSSASRLFAS